MGFVRCGTWCEENGVDKEISKFIKAHQPDYLDAAYQHSDLLEQRREALQRWATMSQDKTYSGELSTELIAPEKI